MTPTMTTNHPEIERLNQEIVAAHHAHVLPHGKNELIDETAAPNGNMVYHLYSNGTITRQKGGFAYLNRTEFTHESHIMYKQKVGKMVGGELKYIDSTTSFMRENYHKTIALYDELFVFPMRTEDYGHITYAILTKEECELFREKMGDLIKVL